MAKDRPTCEVCPDCSDAPGHGGRCRCGHPCEPVQGFCYHHRVYVRSHHLGDRDGCRER